MVLFLTRCYVQRIRDAYRVDRFQSHPDNTIEQMVARVSAVAKIWDSGDLLGWMVLASDGGMTSTDPARE